MNSALKCSALCLLGLWLSACSVASRKQEDPQVRLQTAANAFGVADSHIARLADGGFALTGRLGGNAFAVRVPSNWNGQAVLYAHGYNPPLPDARERPPVLQLESTTAAPDALLLANIYKQGFAVADSNYAKVGYAVKEGFEATASLRNLLTKAGVNKQYIVGASMGGNITAMLIEKYPDAFVGALPLCGVMAGWRTEMRYLLDFRVIYDYFTKGTAYALPGSGDASKLDPGYTQDAVSKSVGSLFGAAGKGDEAARAVIGQVSHVAATPADPISFIVPLSATVNGLSDLLTTMNGLGYSNVGRVYAGSADDAALNAGVERFSVSPESSAYLDAYYTPNGKFKTRVLSLHNLSDPLVPYLHQLEYAAIVAKAGNSANLVRQVIDPAPVNLADLSKSGPAHCYFSANQLTAAWNELRGWVERGVRPLDGANISHVR